MKTVPSLGQDLKSNRYSTKHIFCAAYLLTRGHKITDIATDYGEKSVMQFEGQGVEQDALDFFNGIAKKINPKVYADGYRHIKDLLFKDK